jgi:hypothetical protein
MKPPIKTLDIIAVKKPKTEGNVQALKLPLSRSRCRSHFGGPRYDRSDVVNHRCGDALVGEAEGMVTVRREPTHVVG